MCVCVRRVPQAKDDGKEEVEREKAQTSWESKKIEFSLSFRDGNMTKGHLQK